MGGLYGILVSKDSQDLPGRAASAGQRAGDRSAHPLVRRFSSEEQRLRDGLCKLISRMGAVYAAVAVGAHCIWIALPIAQMPVAQHGFAAGAADPGDLDQV